MNIIKFFIITLFSLFLFGLGVSVIGFVFNNEKQENYIQSSFPSLTYTPFLTSEKEYKEYPKTFFIDIDGTIVQYPEKGQLDRISEINGYVEELLPSAIDFFKSLKDNDVVIFTTGRREKHRELTERTLKYHNIKYKHLIMDLPWGERYLINDTPNMLYQKAIAINLLRDKGFGDIYNYDPKS